MAQFVFLTQPVFHIVLRIYGNYQGSSHSLLMSVSYFQSYSAMQEICLKLEKVPITIFPAMRHLQFGKIYLVEKNQKSRKYHITDNATLLI